MNLEQFKLKDKNILIGQIDSSDNLKSLKIKKKPFACLIISFKSLNSEKKDKISDFIIQKGCRYISCSQKECNKWEDAFDRIFLEKFEYNPPKDYTFITTSHKGESIKEIVSYLFLNTIYGKNKLHFKDYLILFIGKNNQMQKKYTDEIMKWKLK